MTTIRNPAILIAIILSLIWVLPAGADELTAIGIYDRMIHYESDQLSQMPKVDDYHCTITETTVRTGVTAREIVEKDCYFMVPTFQMELIGDQAAHYFDDTLMIHYLESFELKREPNTVIDGVECYAFRSASMEPAFSDYNRIFFVAKDDFRHVRTTGTIATRDFDNLTMVINYTYGEEGPFELLKEKVVEYKDMENNIVATVTATYSDYEFGQDLDIAFFANFVGTGDPVPPLN